MQAFVAPTPLLGARAPRAPRRRPRPQIPSASASPDVVIIGAGIAGLSTAYELAQRGASVRIHTSPARAPAANASAGMLAPNAEPLPADMRRLCCASRNMYPEFVRRLQRLVDADVQYVSRNDFLLPSMHPLAGHDVLTGDALRSVEPALGPRVVCARRSGGDASVDSRRLMIALRKACLELGVQISENHVRSILVSPDSRFVQGLQTDEGTVAGGHYLVASGAWTNKLLPSVPVRPVKGQMLSVAPLDKTAPRLNHVLYSHDVYIVPKDGGDQFYVGATVEHAGFDTRTTAGGIAQLLHAATQIVPAFTDYEIMEMWSGLRPATPDLLPILGHSEFDNASIAAGYYRNGILLAPVTSKIAAAVALGETKELSGELQDLVGRFSYQRFIDSSKQAPEETRRNGETGNQPARLDVKSVVSQNSEHSHQQAPDVKLWKVLPNGQTEPVLPGERYRSQSQSTTSAPKPSESEQEVKLWKVLPDGQAEPVYPGEAYAKSRSHSPDPDLERSSPSTSSRTVEPGPARDAVKQAHETPGIQGLYSQEEQPQRAPKSAMGPASSTGTPTVSKDLGVYQGGAGFDEAVDAESISGENDAYEDVMKNRGNMDETMSRAMAANRAFGRTKSSLECEGSIPLSISEEEVIAFDKAAEQGLQDMRDFEAYFDPNDKSVLATRAEKEGIERESSGVSVNGVIVPALNDEHNSQKEPAGYY